MNSSTEPLAGNDDAGVAGGGVKHVKYAPLVVVKIKFDSKNPEETEKARAMISDMLRRGCTLLIETKDGKTRRCVDFDPKSDTYIVEDMTAIAEAESESTTKTTSKGSKKPGKGQDAVPATEAKATAVGRQAGG